MTVHQIETEMSAQELVEWFAHFKLSRVEAEFEQQKAKNKAELERGRL